jgi:hypothetical protein
MQAAKGNARAGAVAGGSGRCGENDPWPRVFPRNPLGWRIEADGNREGGIATQHRHEEAAIGCDLSIPILQRKETRMDVQHLLIPHPGILSDPEWIALESIEEQTSRFVFDDSMLHVLADRGLVESAGESWRITEHGQRRLNERDA